MFTRRPLCQLSYTGGDLLMVAEPGPDVRIWPLTRGLTCTIIVRQLSRTTASCPASTGYERSCAAVCAECVLKSFESGAPASLGQRRAAPAMTLLPGHLLASLHRMSGRTFPRPGHPITHPVAGARLNAPCAEIRLGARRGGEPHRMLGVIPDEHRTSCQMDAKLSGGPDGHAGRCSGCRGDGRRDGSGRPRWARRTAALPAHALAFP